MDPLTALGLASNIVQFVQFSREVLSTAHDLYKSVSGATAEHFELNVLVESIQNRARKINFSPSGASLTDEEKNLQGLSRQCKVVAEELLTVLRSLKVDGKHMKWSSLYQALRSMKNKTRIEDLQRRLDRLSNQMNFQTILGLQTDILMMVQNLQDENKILNGSRVNEITNLTVEIKKLFKQIEDDRKGNGTTNDDLAGQLLRSSEKGLRFSAEQRILRFLRFEAMDYRYRTIHAAHAGTFRWIEDPTTSLSGIQTSRSFMSWLESNDNLYWISGKIGSGKSTLMKYLCERKDFRDALKVWAGVDGEIVVASFFLWSAGKIALQKSQAGLLRYILYQILGQCPSLIPHAYPEQWEAWTSKEGLRIAEFNQSDLTVLELLAAIQRVFTEVEKTNLRFCIFIDGLDEYDGKPEDMIKLIDSFKLLSHVKLCVSSRPWNSFQTAYGGDGTTQLSMQDLTRKDIELYVRDTLEADADFQELKEDDDNCVDLIREIVERANGVFLWVRLVVQS